MLTITEEQYKTIVKHATDGLPFEACGLVAGELKEDLSGVLRIATNVYTLTNIDQSAEHFSMDPSEQFKVISEVRKNGLVLLANFHSHPATPARPSEEDIQLAYDPKLLYLILSLKDSEPVLKGFRIQNGTVEEEPIRIDGIGAV